MWKWEIILGSDTSEFFILISFIYPKSFWKSVFSYAGYKAHYHTSFYVEFFKTIIQNYI